MCVATGPQASLFSNFFIIYLTILILKFYIINI